MRWLLPLALVACTHAGDGGAFATLPHAPAVDLAAARPAVSASAGSGGSGGSGDAPHLAAKDPRIIDLDVIRIRATSRGPGGEPELETVSTAQLFNAANAAAKDQRGDEAIGLYRRIVTDFGDSAFAPVCLFNIAAIYDARGDTLSTINTLRELVHDYPAARESIDGHLYIAALQLEHHQFADAVKTLDELLGRPNLTYADKVEADARRGYAQLELGAWDDASTSLEAALAEQQRAPHVDDAYYVAMASYYLGELEHRRFTAAPVRAPDERILADLEAKRVLAVKAYDRWRATLDWKQPYWASAAGYQMSEIFYELWEATVRAPWPERVGQGARSHYAGELHGKTRDWLVKALDGHRANIELAAAYGVETSWSRGSGQRAADILAILAREDAGQLVTP